MYNDLVLISYKGACGGETLSWFLDVILNGQNRASTDAANRTSHKDFTNNLFLNWVTPANIAEQFSLREDYWSKQDPELIRPCFDWFYRQSRERRKICKAHCVFRSSQLRPIFQDAFLIDLIPAQSDIWLPLVLYIYKVGLSVRTELTLVGNRLDTRNHQEHPQYETLVRQFERDGWVYHYLLEGIEEGAADIYDWRAYVDYRCSPRTPHIGLRNLDHADYVINATEFLTDPSLTVFEDLALTFQARIPQEIIAKMKTWVGKNVDILEFFGLSKYVGISLTIKEQRAMMIEYFATHGDRFAKILQDQR